MATVWVYWLEGADTHKQRYNKATVHVSDEGLLIVTLLDTTKIVFNANVWLRYEAVDTR